MIEVEHAHGHTHTHIHTHTHTHNTHTHHITLFELSSQKQLKGNIPPEKLFACSNYLIGLVFKSLREMFSNARKIQVNKPQSLY